MEDKKTRFRLLNQTVRGKILFDEPLSVHTSYRIGGPADFYFFPKDMEDLISAIQICDQMNIPRFVIGNGTNLLVSDEGFRGLVIDLSMAFKDIRSSGLTVTAGAAVTLWDLIGYLTERGLSGMEQLAGIPGQIGGGIVLNAGAFGVEIGQFLTSVAFVDPSGRMLIRQRKEIKMDYRKTDLPPEGVVVQAQFHLNEGNPVEMEAVQRNILAKRREKQPLSLPSAGSVFKRPPGDFAGRLIEEAGLKGLRIGDALVSKKHANFIVNCQSARAADVMRLIEEIRKQVLARFDVELETEIHFLGF